jgi:hypothetical protein
LEPLSTMATLGAAWATTGEEEQLVVQALAFGCPTPLLGRKEFTQTYVLSYLQRTTVAAYEQRAQEAPQPAPHPQVSRLEFIHIP